MQFFSRKNKQTEPSGELRFGLPNEPRQEVPREDATAIHGGDRSSTLVDSPMAFSPASTIPLRVPIADDRASRWSSSVQALLDQPPSTLPQQLVIGGAVFCLAFTAWAWFGTVEEVGKAQGKLVPKGETYKIQPIELGQVSEIAVKEGQAVKAGQLMVKLDPELAQKEVERLQQMINGYHLELNQKQALRERVELEAKTQAAIASAELSSQRATIALAEEKRATIRQLQAQQQSEATAYQLRQMQRQPLAALAKERLRQLQAEKVAHQQRINRVRPLEAEGAVSQEFIFQAEQALRETEQRITFSQLQEVTEANEQVFQANQALRDLKAKITETQGDLLRANREVEQAQADWVAKQAESQKIQIEALQKMQQLDVEITQLQAKIADTKNLLVSAQTKLQEKYLKAPVSGSVLSLNLKNTGQVVESGQTVAEIAPEGAPLVVSAVLPNQEAGFVEQGMPVQVKLDAYPYQDYGVIPGRVTEISADAKSNKQLGEVYRVEVQLERDHVTKNQQVIPFKAGQTATADIIIRKRRIMDVLLDPIKQIQKDGLSF